MTLQSSLVKEKPLQLFSKYQCKMGGEDKWGCPNCGCPNEKINANWLHDRLFKCPGCGTIFEGFGRVWWLIE